MYIMKFTIDYFASFTFTIVVLFIFYIYFINFYLIHDVVDTYHVLEMYKNPWFRVILISIIIIGMSGLLGRNSRILFSIVAFVYTTTYITVSTSQMQTMYPSNTQDTHNNRETHSNQDTHNEQETQNTQDTQDTYDMYEDDDLGYYEERNNGIYNKMEIPVSYGTYDVYGEKLDGHDYVGVGTDTDVGKILRIN